MKKTKLFISIVVLFAWIGCGEDTHTPDFRTVPPDFGTVPDFITVRFGEPWDMMGINGERFKKNFDDKEESAFERKFFVTTNSVIFDLTGLFTLQLGFRTIDRYAKDPELFMIGCISYTTRGTYTSQENTLTITRQSTQIQVDVILEPEDAWEQQSEGQTLKQLKSQFTYEIKKDLEWDTPPLFKTDTEYIWQVEGGTLTLSSPQQTISLTRPHLDELIIE